jgi:hypothetical protein
MLGLVGEIFECNLVPNFALFLVQLLGLNVVLGGNMPFIVFFFIVRLGNLFGKTTT